MTVTNSYLHDHWKASLVGHSDNNGAQDVAITVTFALNRWVDLNSRTPSFRFGHGHIFNNVFDANNDGINTRDGAQLLVEDNVWTGTDKPLYDTDGGFAVARGNGASRAFASASQGCVGLTAVRFAQTLVARRTPRPWATSRLRRTATRSSAPAKSAALSRPVPGRRSPSKRVLLGWLAGVEIGMVELWTGFVVGLAARRLRRNVLL